MGLGVQQSGAARIVRAHQAVRLVRRRPTDIVTARPVARLGRPRVASRVLDASPRRLAECACLDGSACAWWARSCADRRFWGGQNPGQPGGQTADILAAPPTFLMSAQFWGGHLADIAPYLASFGDRGASRTCASHIPFRAAAAESDVGQQPCQQHRAASSALLEAIARGDS